MRHGHCGEMVLRSLLVAILLLAYATPAPSQTLWFKYSANPVLDVGPVGSWDESVVEGARVIRVRDTLKMWYEGYSPGNFGRIGYAWSTDGGYTWKKHRSNPVMVPTQKWENGWCFSPYVIFTGSRYKMWYTGNDGDGHIGYATSRDGIGWTKHGGNPVLYHGPSRWDAPRIEGPSVLGPDSLGGFRMWYTGWSEGWVGSQIGYATATDETTWTKQDQLNPVLAPGSGSWDARYVRFARVIYDGHVYESWFNGGSHYIESQHIGYAASLDGKTWKKSAIPVLRFGRPDPWDAKGVCMPEVIFDGTYYHMWYSGFEGAKMRIGYAISPKGATAEITPSYRYLMPGRDTVHIRVACKGRDVVARVGKHLEFSAKIKVAPPLYHNPLELTGMDIFDHVDTLSLFDDGAHGDDLLGDGVFANLWVPGEEQLYVVDLGMKLYKEGTRQFKIDHAGVFTTIGPITLDRVQFMGDSAAHPGDTVLVKLTLRNHGVSTTAPSVRASISTADAAIMTVSEMSPYYWSIPANSTSTTDGYYRILINPYYPSESVAKVDVAISCWEIPLWYDTFTIRITPPWWKTTWAYAGYAVLAGIMVLGMYRYNIRRLRVRHQLKMKVFEAQQLHEVDRMKSRFFANISHEFRTPLTLIQGPATQLLRDEENLDVKGNAGMIVKNARRLLTLVNQLLDLSKIEAGTLMLRVEELDLVDLVKGIAAAFESLSKRKGVEFRVESFEEYILGWFDRDAVEKIIDNLLSNAFKFTDPGGKVTLAMRHFEIDGRESARLSVSDTGIGIAPDQLGRIFERFYQVDGSHTREQEGTGIGLSLTRELVELHKGRITVSSELGVGSTFTVELPLGKGNYSNDQIVETERSPAFVDVSTEAQWSEPEETEQGQPKGKTDLPLVLIVEDNADMQKYIRTCLGREYRIIEAMDGQEGVQRAVGTIPDLVVSDVMMPKMDGFELCRVLKQDERSSHVPIILLTAKADTAHKIEGLETGADDYITKPFDARELLVRARNLIEQRKKLQKRFHKNGIFALEEIDTPPLDRQFLTRAAGIVEAHMSDSSFTADQFASEMYLSRVQSYRKMRALTGLPPWHFVRKIRLHRAADLLGRRVGNVAEIAYQVGYESPSRFSEAFREEFGQSPSEFEVHPNS
jgi:signal transduction histidine kinase/DNA-binding response OmpR family regulator/predicted GH43/DUF377 family glycosyl hydrolase